MTSAGRAGGRRPTPADDEDAKQEDPMVSSSSETAAGPRTPESAGARGTVWAGDAGHRRIFLVRHGRTSLNAAGVLRGRLNPGLDETGLVEANAVADAIGHADLAVLVASPLQRAVDTAARIGARADLRVEVDERLIDRDYGGWAGKPKSELIARWGSLDAAPEVEPAADVLARAMDAFNDVARRTGSGSAAMVTHDAVLQLLLPELDPRLEQVDPLPQETGCFDVIEQRGDGWMVTRVNVTPSGHHDDPPAGSGASPTP
jgi:broad specificity phosphatase PhoE